MTKTPNTKIQKRDLKVGKNAGIIDKILFLEEGEFDEASLKQNFIKLWEEREEIFIMKEEVKLPDNAILRFIIGVEGWSFEVIKDDEVLCEFDVNSFSDPSDIDSCYGFSCYGSVFSGKTKELIVDIEEDYNFDEAIEEISEKGWLNKFGLYTTAMIKVIEERK